MQEVVGVAFDYNKCPFLRRVIPQLKEFGVELEIDPQTLEILGVKIGQKLR
jgi:hypothetical protein